MDWLAKNADWVFSGIGVRALDVVYTLIAAVIGIFFIRKKIKPITKKIARVFIMGSKNKTNINQ
ncbi:hypothetical protein F157LOC_04068 [Pectobacterium brasiliense]|uniref:hypothetical protein n=1 Tax=Pectobacterium brasiliense TaxID=180957 RepID=UPI000CE69AA7|nr:hypothetical protein [Pectobacterium brasiliense]PPE56420.1 hypothetical protein F157LOC_04068 [Pectobacterium brasiliense]